MADVAMGRLFSLYPLQLVIEQEQIDPTGLYRIINLDEGYMAIQQMNGAGDWQTAYKFTLLTRQLPSFTKMCEFQQTSPQPYFTRNKICTIATPGGRITLTDDKLKITEGKRVTEIAVNGPDDFT